MPVIVITRFKVADRLEDRDALQAEFEESAPRYQKIPGLIRKNYIRSEDGTIGGGVYLYETREAAEKVYTPEYLDQETETSRHDEMVEKKYGQKPEILWFESPVIVDNTLGTITTDE